MAGWSKAGYFASGGRVKPGGRTAIAKGKRIASAKEGNGTMEGGKNTYQQRNGRNSDF